jgi:hypothetical protein
MPKRFALTLTIALALSTAGTAVALPQDQPGAQYDGCVSRQASTALYNGCSLSLHITLCDRSEIDGIPQTGCQKNTIYPNSSQSDEGIIYDKWGGMIYACANGYHAVTQNGVDIAAVEVVPISGGALRSSVA